jgi:2-haloacid dehalogenase
MQQVVCMQRREFFMGLSSAGAAATGLSACVPPATPPATGRGDIRAICFDLFTLFDPRSVVDAAGTFFGDRAAPLCELWRTRQFEYCWLRAAAGVYADFRQVTGEALEYAARASRVSLSDEARESLIDAHCRLEPWPDTRVHLAAWRAAGLRLAPLANYSPAMLEALVDHAGLSNGFDALISTDAVRTFKPDPRAYALGASTFGLDRRQVAFSAFGGWDAAGAKWFGFHSFWVNRLNVPREELASAYDATGPTLSELAGFVKARV